MKDILLRCRTCHLLFEGVDIKGLCPRCRTPFLEIAAKYPHVEEGIFLDKETNEEIFLNS